MGLDSSGNGSSETTYDEGDGNLAVVGSVTIVWLTTEADDCVIVLTDVEMLAEMQAVEVDAQRHRLKQANLDGLR